jgi:hypothetical protein
MGQHEQRHIVHPLVVQATVHKNGIRTRVDSNRRSWAGRQQESVTLSDIAGDEYLCLGRPAGGHRSNRDLNDQRRHRRSHKWNPPVGTPGESCEGAQHAEKREATGQTHGPRHHRSRKGPEPRRHPDQPTTRNSGEQTQESGERHEHRSRERCGEAGDRGRRDDRLGEDVRWNRDEAHHPRNRRYDWSCDHVSRRGDRD